MSKKDKTPDIQRVWYMDRGLLAPAAAGLLAVQYPFFARELKRLGGKTPYRDVRPLRKTRAIRLGDIPIRVRATGTAAGKKLFAWDVLRSPSTYGRRVRNALITSLGMGGARNRLFLKDFMKILGDEVGRGVAGVITLRGGRRTVALGEPYRALPRALRRTLAFRELFHAGAPHPLRKSEFLAHLYSGLKARGVRGAASEALLRFPVTRPVRAMALPVALAAGILASRLYSRRQAKKKTETPEEKQKP